MTMTTREQELKETSGTAAGVPADMRLLKLSDTDMTVADPSEDIRGRKVRDNRGEEVGDVDDLLIDDRERKVRFLRVAAGGFLGIGETKFLVPVDAITHVGEDSVTIDQSRERVAGAPRYDPDLAYDVDYYGGLYGYYGYPPYWTPGYLYPAYPYYPASPRRL
jgi:sporulation protein YlmC with PRC-barrel domain